MDFDPDSILDRDKTFGIETACTDFGRTCETCSSAKYAIKGYSGIACSYGDDYLFSVDFSNLII